MDIELKRTDEEILDLFFKLQSREDVANILEIDIKTLIYIVYRTNNNRKYNEFAIKKRDGTDRIIKAPNNSLKIIQSKLNKILQLLYKEKGKDSAHGFINDRSILTNATPHVCKKEIFNVDLKDFFNSINFGRVRGMFNKTFNIGLEAATTLAQISCHNNSLPQGSPCSPVISNLICRQLDSQLYHLGRKCGCRYTRYADDITFSCNKESFPNNITYKDANGVIHVSSHFKKIISDNGFDINEKKLCLSNQYEHQEVTGLVVNKKINVRYSYIKNLRSMLFKSMKYGVYKTSIEYIDKFAHKIPESIRKAKGEPEKYELVEKWFLRVMEGKLFYLKMIRGERDSIFQKYASIFNKIYGSEAFQVISQDNLEDWLSKRIVVVDPINEKIGNGTGFFLKNYGLITCFHVVEKVQDYCKIFNPYTKYSKTIIDEEIIKNSDLDIAIYASTDNNPFFEMEENPDYRIGQTVRLVGYPEYIEGNKLDIRKCRIASSSFYLGQKLYIIDGDIFHGSSGGVVLNYENKVIGIIRSGISSLDDDAAKNNMKRGFIPIKEIEKL